MSCEKYREALIEAAAVGGANEAGLAQHLARCSQCRALWQREHALFRAIDGALRERMNQCPGESFLPRIRNRIAHAAESEARWNPSWAWAGAALALLVFATAHPWTVLKQYPVDRNLNGVPVHVSPRSVRQNSERARSARGSTEISLRPEHVRRHSTEHSLAKQSAPREPEVLVPPDEAKAFAQFVARVASGDRMAEAVGRPAKDNATAGNLELPESFSFDVADLQREPLKWKAWDEGWDTK
jgi:hypothetical protein